MTSGKNIILLVLLLVLAAVNQAYASEVTGTITAGQPASPAGRPAQAGSPVAFTVVAPGGQSVNTPWGMIYLDGLFLFKSALVAILIAELVILFVISINKRRKILEG